MKAGDAYRRLISEQLVEQRDRKKSLEQRGVAVITTASVLASLLLGIGALAGGSDTFTLPDSSRPFVGLALVLFVLSGSLAIGTNWPRSYEEPTNEALRKLATPEEWMESDDTGAMNSAAVEVVIIARAREVNGQKAMMLIGAMIAQLVAVLLFGWAVWLILSAATQALPAAGA